MALSVFISLPYTQFLIIANKVHFVHLERHEGHLISDMEEMVMNKLRVMLAQGSGSIVNVSSAYGSVGAAGASVYVASKHAIEGLTKSAALEVAGTGVRVNVVAPGTTDTGMLTRFTSTDKNKAALVATVPFKRLATPEEIAHVIAFVASKNASYMTGASIPVDGGMLAD
jgi:NAD(P)-dependent dehydrogenase (short-subunit alcohol dehydrogenase family)